MSRLKPWQNRLRYLSYAAGNVTSAAPLVYITESADWAIWQVGRQLTDAVMQHSYVRAQLSTSPWALRHRLLHFGSLHTLSWRKRPRAFHPSNIAIATVYHLIPGRDTATKLGPLLKHVTRVHTASSLTKQQLIAAEIPSEKIQVIPLGINTQLFQPGDAAQRQQLRQQLNIPANRFVIGSFQKDGVGWQEGLRPKLEKGPDVFVEVLRQLSTRYPIHALLVGPARGYVHQELTRYKIPYTHLGWLSDYHQVAPYYQALDAYLIASRIEGGPLALLEAWASGVPVISTRVGMVPDLALDGQHALLANSEDTEGLANQLARLITHQELQHKLRRSGLEHVQQYNWPKLASRYYQELYAPLLKKL